MPRPALLLVLAATLLTPPVVGQSDFVSADALRSAGLATFWQFQVSLEPDQAILDAYLVDDHLYLGTNDGYVFALDARTGVLRWLQPVTRSGYRLRRPCHAAGRTIFVTPVDIQAYDKLTGDGVGRQALRFPPGSGCASDGDRVFVGGLDARVYAFDARTLAVDWKITVDGPVRATPVVQGRDVLIADDGRSVYCTTRTRKGYRWSVMTSGANSADLVTDDAGVYVASQDQSLYVYDLGFVGGGGGHLRWRALFNAPLRDPPVVTPHTVFQYVPGTGLAALETGQPYEVDERVRWMLPEGRAALTVHEGRVYVLGSEELLAVELKSGTVTHRVPTPGLSIGLPSPDNASVYLVASNGRIFCARPIGAPPLRDSDIRAAETPGTAQPPNEESAATQPAAAAAPPLDVIRSRQTGAPVGGKSKVTRGFRGDGK